MDTIPETLPNFAGKIVVLYSKSWESTNVIGSLASPEFEYQAGRLFLIGDSAASADSWANGASAGVAWDEVSSYIILDKEDYHEKQRQWKKEHKSSGGSSTGGLFSFLRRG